MMPIQAVYIITLILISLCAGLYMRTHRLQQENRRLRTNPAASHNDGKSASTQQAISPLVDTNKILAEYRDSQPDWYSMILPDYQNNLYVEYSGHKDNYGVLRWGGAFSLSDAKATFDDIMLTPQLAPYGDNIFDLGNLLVTGGRVYQISQDVYAMLYIEAWQTKKKAAYPILRLLVSRDKTVCEAGLHYCQTNTFKHPNKRPMFDNSIIDYAIEKSQEVRVPLTPYYETHKQTQNGYQRPLYGDMPTPYQQQPTPQYPYYGNGSNGNNGNGNHIHNPVYHSQPVQGLDQHSTEQQPYWHNLRDGSPVPSWLYTPNGQGNGNGHNGYNNDYIPRTNFR